MKKDKLAHAMDLVDEDLIARASPTYLPRRNATRRKRVLSILAACLALCLLIGNLWLFLPYGGLDREVMKYRDSEYYGLIKKINQYTSVKNKYKNNFDRLSDTLRYTAYDGAVAAPGDPGANKAESSMYEEVTDNQVAGVIEADLIKRTDTHAFYLDEHVLRVFSLAGDEACAVGSLDLRTKGRYIFQWEFFLSQDGKTVTVMAPYYDSALRGTKTEVISVDVSDPTAMAVKSRMTVSGEYLSSRFVEGGILLLTRFYIAQSPDFSDEKTFLPQIDLGSGPRSISPERIVSPEELSSRYYTVALLLDAGTLAPKDETAFLSYSSEVYVSEQHIVVSRVYQQKEETEQKHFVLHRTMTELYCLGYTAQGFAMKGSVTVAGSVKDQYSLDEHEGILRAVTTLSETVWRESGRYREISAEAPRGGTNASLYCIDLATLSVVASKEAFAPEGESVQSVRFDGDAAYVCTAVVLTDPVFFFDLSDLSNITYTETDTIEGYSSSLVQLGEGFLLGIGVGGSWDVLKLEVYIESDGRVISVDKFEVPGASFSMNYKSYFIDRENGYIGLGVHTYAIDQWDKSSYLLFCFDRESAKLSLVAETALAGDDGFKRGFVADGYLYVFGQEDFKAVKIN